MKVTPTGFARMTSMLCACGTPMALALEGGYNELVTNECCEAVVRTA